LLPRLSTDRLNRDANGAWAERPLAAIEEIGGRAVIVAVNAAAEAAGSVPGMSLADARALCPGLTAVPRDGHADARALDRLVGWCERYTPWVANDGADGLVLDVTGCAHLMGGEAALLQDLSRRLRARGLTVRAALADTPGAARAVARCGRHGTVVPTDGTRTALADLAVEGLGIAPDVLATLSKLGLRTIGSLLPLPRASLAARFGRDLVVRLDRALGVETEPIGPRPYLPPFRERLGFAEPIGTPEDIERGLHVLLERLCRRLGGAGRGCRRLVFSARRVDGTRHDVHVGTASPVRAPDHLARLFTEKLTAIDPGFGIDGLLLEASVTEPLAVDQVAIALRDPDPAAKTPSVVAAGTPSVSPGLARLVDRLGSRLGLAQVVRLVPVESHLPDRAVRAQFACAVLPARGGWPRTPPRPTRLLDRPEPIDAVAPLGPDDPGAAPGLFRWRGRRHRVCAAQGPERLAPEWWRTDDRRAWASGGRDYFRVEDETGARFWIFRTGIENGANGSVSRWYLHGLFP